MGKKKRTSDGVLMAVLLLGISLLLIRCGLKKIYQASYPVRYQQTVERLAEQNGLEPELVLAVIRTESSFNPTAESSVGARGLMQLTDETLAWVSYRLKEEQPPSSEVLFDPEQSIYYGTALLRLLRESFADDRTVLAVYHAGWGAVSGWLEDDRYSSDGLHLETIPYPDTEAYVKKVLQTRQIYENLYGY